MAMAVNRAPGGSNVEQLAPSRDWSWLKSLLGLVVAVVTLTELSARLWIFGIAGLSYEKVNSVHDLGESGLIEPSPYPEIIYQLKPRLRAYFKLALLRTNEGGLADDEYSLLKPPGTFRIAVAGSSFSMPSGVRLEDSWHGILERDLNGQSAARFEVINFAVGGYDLRQIIATLSHRISRYAPDLILVEITRRSPVAVFPDSVYRLPYRVRPASLPFFHSFALDVLLRREPPGDRMPLPVEQARPEFDRLLGELRRWGIENRIPICLVVLQHQKWDPTIDEPLREALRRSGIPSIDTAQAFQSEPVERWVIFKGDPHPNARAHALFEKIILQRLRRGGFLKESR